MRGRAFVRSVLALAALGVAAAASAQAPPVTPEFTAPPLQYNFAPPGARSLAMGASFIGLADDATASESNPAGLTVLTKPEFSAHFRYTTFENEAPDTVIGRGFATFNDHVGSPSFFSVVYPWQNAAASLYYQRSADFRQHSFFDGVIPGTTLPNYDDVRTDFRVENYGLSAAFKLGSKVAVGASARATRVALDSVQVTTFPDSFFGVNFTAGTELSANKSKFTFNAGVLITPTSKVSIGGVYKKGENFLFPTEFRVDITDGVDTVNLSSESVNVRVSIPDVYGGGIAVRPTESFVITADVVRVTWADTDPGPGNESFYAQFGQGGPETIKDGTEIHAGAEYTWAGGADWLFALRGGYYFDPDHDGLAGIDSDQNHVTFGGGFVAKNRVQLDLAANISQNVKEGLLSLVVRF